jgi:signal transduction histidine kinase
MVARVSEAHHALEAKVNERTAQLQERNEELEAFAHSISHDLRAPLRSMHGFSQALLEDNAAQLDDSGKDYARRIAASAGRMDALIQDLLSYSRISRAHISLAPTDLNAVAHAAVSQLEADIASRQAIVTVHEPLPPVLAQRAVLEQIVANLVANALKFVAAGKRPDVHIRAEPGANGKVRLWVEDNGIGIDNAHHQRIFSVFERLHSNEEYAGTGIGLAIVRKGAERLGGHVGVDSALGRGSRFWIELQPAEM